jgi:membrane protein implicated in regulation of membrane protease activity
VTTAQILFSIALGAVTLLITFFALYVVSSTMWGDRWYRRARRL